MKICHIFLFIIFSIIFGNSQTSFTIEDFLAGVEDEKMVVFQSQKVDFLNTTSYDQPIVKKLQFRTELHDFDIRKQEYLLRASLNGFKKRNAQSLYQGSVQALSEIELDVAKNMALRERYDLLVNYIYYQEILVVKKKQNILLQDKVTLLKRSILLTDFDVLDLIKAEDELQNNQQDILDVKRSILSAEQFIIYFSDTKPPLFGNDYLLTVEELSNIVNTMESSLIANTHPQLNLLTAEKETSLLAYDLELAKSNFSINYIQAKYTDDVKDSFRENFSIGLGFDIPMKNTDRLDLNELQLNILATESQYEYVQQQLSLERNLKFMQLQNLIEKYELVQEQLNDNRAEYVLEEYRKVTEVSPIDLLSLRESTLNKELLKQKLHLSIMQTYIAYLDLAGVLSQRPLRNYLRN